MNKDTYETSVRLVAFLGMAGLSKADLARALSVHPSYISGWVSGKREISPLHLRQLAALGCDLNWLLTGRKHNP